MPGEQEEVVSQPKSLQLAQAIQETFLQHEVVIWLIVDDMSDTAEFPVLRKLLKLVHNSIAAQVNPAHYRANKRELVRKLQQPITFFDTLSSLHCDRSTNASAAHQPR